jgi:uncharacterized membrane protein YfcA
MRLRTFFMIAAVVALIYAAALLLVPAFMNSMYGIGTSSSEKLLARFFGVDLLVVGLVLWMGRDLNNVSTRSIVTANLIGNTIGIVVALVGTLTGVMNAGGWSAVLIYLLLALGFAYFQFMAPAI